MKEGHCKCQKCQDDHKGCYWSNTSLTGTVKQARKGTEKRKGGEKVGEKKEVKVKTPDPGSIIYNSHQISVKW